MVTLSQRQIHEISGTASERGRKVASWSAGQRAAVLERINAVSDTCRTAEERDRIGALWELQQLHLPEVCAYVRALAEGMGVAPSDLFHAHIRYAVDDLRRAPAGAEDCSSLILRTDDGLILAKNRDNPPVMRDAQSWLHQRDPAGWGTREVISVSTFGSSAAASSGMNSDGLCLTDTAVRTFDLGPGVLRYYLMDAILQHCASVAEAVDFVRGLPHLGGGNLLLADASGAGAIIEIGHRHLHVEVLDAGGCGPNWLMRTNHFLSDPLARSLCEKAGSPHFINSSKRYAFIKSRLEGLKAPDVAVVQEILASHHESDSHAPICRHEATSGTLSGVVFLPSRRVMLQSTGTPCQGEWMQRGFRDNFTG